MEITPELLAEKFRLYSDEELLELYRSGDLTELAQTVARAELASRGSMRRGRPCPQHHGPVQSLNGSSKATWSWWRGSDPPFWPPAPMLNQLKLLVNSLRQRTISCRICCNPMPSVINDLQGVSAVPRDMRGHAPADPCAPAAGLCRCPTARETHHGAPWGRPAPMDARQHAPLNVT